MSELESVTFSFMSIIFLILGMMLYFRCKYSNVHKYKTIYKLKNINWLKVLKYWVVIQLFCLMGTLTIFGKIIFPLFILIFLIMFALGGTGDPEKEHIENMTIKGNKDFQQWEVAENRNKKINKILR